MDAFGQRLGTAQGRIAPSDFVPPSGSYVFYLGSADEGRVANLNTGDYCEIAQTADFGDAQIVRLYARTRCPAELSGEHWELQVLVDDAVRARRILREDATHVMAGIEFAVSDLAAGPHELKIRLALASEMS